MGGRDRERTETSQRENGGNLWSTMEEMGCALRILFFEPNSIQIGPTHSGCKRASLCFEKKKILFVGLSALFFGIWIDPLK